ncbi:MAG: T9SS type A sorting domain-containing protein [candidate division Zixibacteria bacterium]|nr:T9SS type A sorting domain-containing protein [candidate division Zixibacteria bacterium]MBU1469119.1 T9SS type A sorting domain-containing protein [candidate division Zixibacteria bacterium]MBU2624880.1 T9SS type A sorting domain-containing protein [candidate division Zixibacteria bacterium]
MRFRTLLFLLLVAAMLIIVPANHAILRWIGLDATLHGEELRYGTGTSLTVNDSNTGMDGSDAVDPRIEDDRVSGSNNSLSAADGNIDPTPTLNKSDICSDAPPMIASQPIEINRAGRNPGDTLVFDNSNVTIENSTAHRRVESSDQAVEPELHQNNPNPFNSSTNISFVLPEGGEVSLELFNILGQKVNEVYRGYVDAGFSEFAVDKSIHNLSSGIYFYRLKFDSLSLVKKMIVLR